MTAMNENIELMMPIKAAPYDHQKKAFAFAYDKFGVFDGRLKSRGMDCQHFFEYFRS